MGRERTHLYRWLWVAAAGTFLGLAGLIGVTHTAALEIGQMNRLIAGNTAPGIVALQAAGSDLSAYRIALRDRLGAPDGGRAPDGRINQARRALGEDLERWFVLPIDPGEGEAMADVELALARLDAVAQRILATTADAPPAGRSVLRTELDARADDLEGSLLRGSKLNAELARDGSTAADRSVSRLLPAAVGIFAGCVVLGMLALFTVHRAGLAEAALAEQRRLEAKNAELEAFSSRVAHDLLSPLMSMGLAVGVAVQRLSRPGDEDARNVLARAGSSLQRVRILVSDLLEFARAGAVRPQGAETEVAPVLDGVAQDLGLLASEAGVALHVAGIAAIYVRCAPGVLASILTNLVQNGIRYTSADAPQVEVRVLDTGPEVRFEVEDNGPGVPEADRERIFDPFVRLRESGCGLGLGLATVKRLVESHGGHVGASSPAQGRGALFWVTLPASSPPVSPRSRAGTP